MAESPQRFVLELEAARRKRRFDKWEDPGSFQSRISHATCHAERKEASPSGRREKTLSPDVIGAQSDNVKALWEDRSPGRAQVKGLAVPL